MIKSIHSLGNTTGVRYNIVVIVLAKDQHQESSVCVSNQTLLTLIGCTKSMSVKKEITRVVTHLVTLEFPNMMPYMSRKKQEAAIQPITRSQPKNTVHHGRVNFFFFLQEINIVRVVRQRIDDGAVLVTCSYDPLCRFPALWFISTYSVSSMILRGGVLGLSSSLSSLLSLEFPLSSESFSFPSFSLLLPVKSHACLLVRMNAMPNFLVRHLFLH